MRYGAAMRTRLDRSHTEAASHGPEEWARLKLDLKEAKESLAKARAEAKVALL